MTLLLSEGGTLSQQTTSLGNILRQNHICPLVIGCNRLFTDSLGSPSSCKTGMRQFQPHGVSITLYRTQITPCRRNTNLARHLSYPIMPRTYDPDRTTASVCQSVHHIRATAMDHLSRSVLSFRRDITLRADVVLRARVCHSVHPSNTVGADMA
jgi:hypothetical protein